MIEPQPTMSLLTAEVAFLKTQREELRAELLTLTGAYDRLLLAYGKPFEWGEVNTDVARELLAKTAPAAPAELMVTVWRTLKSDDVIQEGDQWLPAGCIDSWIPVRESIGRTVAVQLLRDTNQSGQFRRRSDARTIDQTVKGDFKKGRWTP